MDYEGMRRLAVGVISFWVGQFAGELPQLEGGKRKIRKKVRLQKDARDFVKGDGLDFWCDVAGVDADRLRSKLGALPK